MATDRRVKLGARGGLQLLLVKVVPGQRGISAWSGAMFVRN